MKTTLQVDEILLNQARKILGTQTIKDTVEQSLRTVIRQKALERLANAGGSIDLDLTVERLRKQRKRRTPHASR
jgi:Arc/MetJ family transcription regulator